jgi:uncharacterized protein YecE (DUF72 family)
MTTKWYIGCSGFHYKEWRDFFYPPKLPQRLWFDYYAERFNTLELNVTFYRFPQLKFLEGWYDKAPAGFVFSAKVPRIITHYKQFRDCHSLISDFYGLLEGGLKDKLGCVLFQMPPQLPYSEEALDRICALVDDNFTNALEFRHASWWNGHVYEVLRQRKIIFCGHSYPNLPDEAIVNAPSAYYRFHGVPKLYYSQYDDDFVSEIASSLSRDPSLQTAFVYFNNTATEAALNNARFLQNFLSDAV